MNDQQLYNLAEDAGGWEYDHKGDNISITIEPGALEQFNCEPTAALLAMALAARFDIDNPHAKVTFKLGTVGRPNGRS